MRLHPILAAACIALSTASPAFAQSPGERYNLTRNALDCQSLYTARKFTQSLLACNAAVAGFDQAAVVQKANPWYAYYMKVSMLEYVARDQSALGHHRASLRSAVDGHRLARYVYINYQLADDDYRTFNALIQRFQVIETQEQRYIKRGEGD
jgi:hypothetical protein